MSLCAHPFNAKLFTRAAMERCAAFKGAAVASRRAEVINVRQAPELCLTDAFTSSAPEPRLLAQANTQTRGFRWKWTTLVRLEVSGDNAAKQRPPFSIYTISMQEMSLRERSTPRAQHYAQTSTWVEMSAAVPLPALLLSELLLQFVVD